MNTHALPEVPLLTEAPGIDYFIAWYNQGARPRCTVTGEFVLFWPGPFSQWAAYDIEVDRVSYNTCEQYMMACKARQFDDFETLARIMAESDPGKQKALGRVVRNFNQDQWHEVAQSVVYTANLAKFSQHSYLQKMLFATADRTIVEASAKDQIWGIGLSFSDPAALFPACWKGTNWLGIAIMQVREHLRNAATRVPLI